MSEPQLRPASTRLVGLEELFEPDDWASEMLTAGERGPVRRPFRDRGWWVRKLLLALGISVVCAAALRLLRLDASEPLIFATVLSLVLLRHAMREVAADPLPLTLTRQLPARVDGADPAHGGVRQAVGPTDGLRFAVGRWEDRLAWSERDPDRFLALVLPRLREVVDERLRQRHGITRASDPQRAQALLGDELWRLLHAPRAVPAGGLRSVVDRLERL